MPPFPPIVLYRRAGCHLCDEARAVLDEMVTTRAGRGETAPSIVERDIDAHEDLQRQFMTTIPVVEIGVRRLELAISPAQLRRFVDTALAAETTTA